MIRGTGLLDSSFQGSFVTSCFYGKMTGLGERGSRKVLFFRGFFTYYIRGL